MPNTPSTVSTPKTRSGRQQPLHGSARQRRAGLEIAEQLIRSSAIDILVVDSVAALTPKSEIDGDMGDRNVGLQARLMSQAMRKLTGTISPHQHHLHIHQPAAREDRRDVRSVRNHHRRQRPQILRLCAESTSVRAQLSKTVTMCSDKLTKVKVAKTRLRLHSSAPNSTSCSAKASRAAARSSTSA